MLRGDEVVILQYCFIDVLLRHTNIMADKELNISYECATRYVYLYSLEEECVFSS